MAATRLSSSRSRSRKAAFAPELLASACPRHWRRGCRARAGAAPRAMAASAASFWADGASARMRAADRARRPISIITAGTSAGETDSPPAGVDGRDLGEAHGPISVEPHRNLAWREPFVPIGRALMTGSAAPSRSSRSGSWRGRTRPTAGSRLGMTLVHQPAEHQRRHHAGDVEPGSDEAEHPAERARRRDGAHQHVARRQASPWNRPAAAIMQDQRHGAEIEKRRWPAR